MTRVARIVLQDTQHALGRHSDTLQSEAFRVSWFTVVGLLRAVGHVLGKVDANESPEMRRAIEEKWAALVASRPEPVIFWGFIDSERNRFLKSYEHGITRTLTAKAGSRYMIVSDRAKSQGSEMNPGTKLDSRTTSGPYAGRKEIQVAWDAYEWWQSYLDEVDAIAASYSAV